jgi:uncharacterized protein YdcH (DUF465 family)
VPVEVKSNEVVVTDLVITDPLVVAEFASVAAAGRDAEEHIVAIISLGAQVASFSSAAASSEKLEAAVHHAEGSMKRLSTSLEDTVRKQVASLEDDAGPLATTIKTVLGELEGNIASLTAGEDSPVRESIQRSLDAVRKTLLESLERQNERVSKEIAELLDPEQPRSPLRALKSGVDEVRSALIELRAEQRASLAVAEVNEAGVKGGLDYESDVVAQLQRIAAATGDDCEPTGHLTGRIKGRKTGDAVSTIKHGADVEARIVVEAKNKRLSRTDWDKERREARENRDAVGFIGLCKHLDDMPNASRILAFSPNEIVVAFDPDLDSLDFLYLVYHLVRMQTISKVGELDEVSIVEVNQALADAITAAQRFDQISKSASAVENAGRQIRTQILDLKNDMLSKLRDASNAVRRGTESLPEIIDVDGEAALAELLAENDVEE